MVRPGLADEDVRPKDEDPLTAGHVPAITHDHGTLPSVRQTGHDPVETGPVRSLPANVRSSEAAFVSARSSVGGR